MCRILVGKSLKTLFVKCELNFIFVLEQNCLLEDRFIIWPRTVSTAQCEQTVGDIKTKKGGTC